MGTELWGDDDFAAGQAGGQDRNQLGIDVKHRHHDQSGIHFAQLMAGNVVISGVQHLAVSDPHPLRFAGGSGGLQDHAQVVFTGDLGLDSRFICRPFSFCVQKQRCLGMQGHPVVASDR